MIMAASGWSVCGLLGVAVTLVVLGRQTEAKPLLKTFDIPDDYSYLFSGGNNAMLADLSSPLNSEDESSSLPVAALELYGIMSRARSKTRGLEKIYSLLNQLKDQNVSPEFHKKDTSFMSDRLLVTKKNEGVLPPWQEFCRMLRMGNCWRFKRSLSDVGQRTKGSRDQFDTLER